MRALATQLNEEKLRKVLSERESERVLLTCPKHRYVGSKMPPKALGCADCWKCYYIFDIATTPPHMRQERLEELETIIRHVAEAEDKGEFDFTAFDPWGKEFQRDLKFERDAE